MQRNMPRRYLLVLSVLLSFGTGCQPNASRVELAATDNASRTVSQIEGAAQPEQAHSPSAQFRGGDLVVEDRLHRRVKFARPPRRIVSLSPATTELLFALGLAECVVGVTKHCNYPPAALNITRVGAGTLEGISRELIVSVEPELILCKWDNHQPLVETFEQLNIPIFAVGAESLEELFEEAEWIGEICGREAEADELVSKMKSRLSRLRKVVAARTSGAKPKRVFYEVWDDPLMSAGPGSFIGEILQLAGLENIIRDTPGRYPRVSAEVVLQNDPEVILAPTTHFQDVEISAFAHRPGWSDITAVREGQIFLIDGDQVSRCSPRLLDALQQIVTSVYPGPAGLDDEEAVQARSRAQETGLP